MGNKLYQRRQTQEDWNGRSTATTRKLVRRQTRKGKTWDRSGEPGAGQVGQVNWPANERQWIDTSETHGWLAGE